MLYLNISQRIPDQNLDITYLLAELKNFLGTGRGGSRIFSRGGGFSKNFRKF